MVTTTLDKYRKNKFIHAAKSYRNLALLKSLIGGGNVVGVSKAKGNAIDSMTVSGGIEYKFAIMLATGTNVKHVGLYSQDTLSTATYLSQGHIPLRGTTGNYIYDEQEIDINSGEEKILSILDPRRAATITDLMETMETTAWGCPTDENDVLTPIGVGYFVVKSSTLTYGANPTGHSSVAGLVHANWRNLAGQYTAVAWDDLIYQMELMYIRLNWQNYPRLPASAEQPELNLAIYVNETTYAHLLGLARSQNHPTNSAELTAYMDRLAFNGVPIQLASALNSDTDNPVYFLNLNYLKFGVRAGWFFKETPPQCVSGSHNVRAIFLDTTWGTMCLDRKTHGVLAQV